MSAVAAFGFATLAAHGDYLPMRYPNGLAWQLDVLKEALRRSPKYHFFLVFETEVVFLAVWSPYSQQP
jgi:hypothetical protein